MKNHLLTPHFALREFTESETARKHGIRNVPPKEAVERLRALCVHTLEPLREALGLPVIITSGYRCKALNDLLVHHSRKSQHREGQAADFYVARGDGSTHRKLLIKAFRLIITNEKIDYDQLILYPDFIHVSFVSRASNRRKIIKANGNGTYCALKRADALGLV